MAILAQKLQIHAGQTGRIQPTSGPLAAKEGPLVLPSKAALDSQSLNVHIEILGCIAAVAAARVDYLVGRATVWKRITWD